MVSRTDVDQKTRDSGLWLLGLSGSVLLLLGAAIVWVAYGREGNLSGDLAGFASLLPASLRGALGAQAQIMDLPLQAGSQAYWYLARAGGVVAYLLLWLSTCWGIMMSSKVIKGVVSVPVAYALHEYLPVLAIVFAALHAAILLGDTYIGFSPLQIIIPFTSPYKPFWTGLGSIAFYLSVALIASFYLRKRIGQKAWRAFHYLAYLGFALALAHGLMAGSDSTATAMRLMYGFTAVVSLFLIYYRTLAHVPRPQRGGSTR